MKRFCAGCARPFNTRDLKSSRCDSCRRQYEREKSRRRRALKGTTSQRGYGTDHQRLSKLAIAQHPWCTDCGKTTDLTGDHIVPTSKGGLNVLSNYAVRCRGCNTAAKKRECVTVMRGIGITLSNTRGVIALRLSEPEREQVVRAAAQLKLPRARFSARQRSRSPRRE